MVLETRLTLTLHEIEHIPDPRFMNQYCVSSAGRGAMPFLMSFALEHEIVTLAWIENAFAQFPINIHATKV